MLDKQLHVHVSVCCPRSKQRQKKRKIYLVPGIGVATEHLGPVTPTPEHYGRPPKKARILMAFQLSATQQNVLTVAPKDRKGNPAPVQDPVWQVDNPNLLALTPSADGLSCTAVAVGPIGSGTVTFRCDADLGAGVVELVGTETFDITAGLATTIAISAGPASEQP